MNKQIRIKVYEKYQGHCAYCGKIIEYKDMQVDHIQPKRNGGTNDIDNLNPSCRSCNHYKRAFNLDGYRKYIQTLDERIKENYINKVAMNYEIIQLNKFDGKFYFERIKEND